MEAEIAKSKPKDEKTAQLKNILQQAEQLTPKELIALKSQINDASKLEQITKAVIAHATDINGRNALHIAAKTGDLLKLNELLSSGIAVNSRDKSAMTALHIAVQYGNIDIVKALIDRGADVNATDNDGKSPLILAVQGDKFAILEIIVKAGANLNVRDNSGRSALTISIEKGKVSIADILMRNGAKLREQDLNKRNSEFLKLYKLDRYTSKNIETAIQAQSVEGKLPHLDLEKIATLKVELGNQMIAQETPKSHEFVEAEYQKKNNNNKYKSHSKQIEPGMNNQ